ncbi:MAG: helix-turn-helix domain-containing protein [Hyphomicrobiaceae bacterium]
MLTMREDYNVSEGRAPILPFQSKPLRQTTLADHMAGAPLRGVEAKDHLFTEGEAKTHVYQVVTGAVCLYKVLPDGRRQVIDFAYGGDMIGLGLGPVEACNAQATVATRVRCLPVSSLRSILRNEPAIAVKICEALTQELTAIRDHLVCVVQRSATERLVTFLLALSQRNRARDRDPSTIELPMTRADIGDFLGLTIETVSRTFSKLKACGVLEIDQGTTIRLRDIAELRALADGAELA